MERSATNEGNIDGLRVLITDGNNRNALAAVRSLGKRGTFVAVGAASRYAQSYFSRYCRKRVRYPPITAEEGFVQSIIQAIQRYQIDVVLPIGYATNVAISKHQDKLLNFTALPVAPWESMQVASSKDKTVECANRLGVHTPVTYQNIDAVDHFPIVVKATKESRGIRYVNSMDELRRTTTEDCILQEYVPGDGYGFFALYNKGNIRAFFMHKRIREFPSSGGPSTAAESIYDEELKETATTLLEGLQWHGVAMVEFKKDHRDGKFKLMEVNPKFWGSLDLSIASGVDFPYLAVKMALDGDVEPVLEYKVGQRFRWLFPYDFLHVLANPRSLRGFMGDFFNPKTRTDFSWSDPIPNLFHLLSTGPLMINRMRHGGLRHPHGMPKWSQ